MSKKMLKTQNRFKKNSGKTDMPTSYSADDGPGIVTMKTGAAGLKPFKLYMRAHNLISGDYQSCNRKLKPESVDESIKVLSNPGHGYNKKKLLRAIGVLGHTASPVALETLYRFSSTDDALAPVAELALAECSSIMKTEGEMSMAIN